MGKINHDDLLTMLKSGRSQADCARYFHVSEAAISKAVKRIRAAEIPSSMEGLTDKQRAFILNLAEGNNATEAAMRAYDCASRAVAKTLGCRMSKEPEIETALADIMASEGLTRRRRVQRLKALVESKDLGAASRALDMSFKLDGSYVTEKPFIQVDFKQMQVDVDKAIDAMIEAGLMPRIKDPEAIDIES
jgi:hypothetical protein